MATYVQVLPGEVRTSSATSKTVRVWEKYVAAHVVVNHPNIGGGITVGVYGQDVESDRSYLLLSSNIVASGHTVMKIGPEYTAGANVAKDYIPYNFYVSVTASGTNFYSVGASLM